MEKDGKYVGLEVALFLVKDDRSLGGLVINKKRSQMVEIKFSRKAKTIKRHIFLPHLFKKITLFSINNRGCSWTKKPMQPPKPLIYMPHKITVLLVTSEQK